MLDQTGQTAALLQILIMLVPKSTLEEIHGQRRDFRAD